MNKFNEFGLSQELNKTIEALGFEEPTQIQAKSIPEIIKGNDVIAESSTGSGKTLAFACGIIDHTEPHKGLQSLVLTPTRELTEQVKGSIQELAQQKKLKVISVYGGVAINPQITGLKKANIVVATPGRFLDHLQRRTIDVSRIKTVVLDEADRMFDMGFIDDIKKILDACKSRKQTLLFSATISPSLKDLAKNYMNTPQEIFAEKMVDPSKLKQVYYDVPRNLKLSLLLHLLENEESGLTMVFCNSRKATDVVSATLKKHGIKAIPIHGGLSQNKRSNTMDDFNKNKIGVLVCTDVAARGLHIDDVSHVYNYEIPRDARDYVHRIGRTARAGEDGKVINLLSDYDHDNYAKVLAEYREFNIEKLEKPYIERIETSTPDRRPTRGESNSRGPRHNSRGPRRNFNGKGRFQKYNNRR
jgi:ATP-dependent RNA helicase DeaD